MSVIVQIPEIHLNIALPGVKPQDGLFGALNIIRSALSNFASTPSIETLGAAIAGRAWVKHTIMSKITATPAMTQRTSHIVTVGVTPSPTISVWTVVYDKEDDTFGKLHEGTFVAADVLRDIPTLVRALTNG